MELIFLYPKFLIFLVLVPTFVFVYFFSIIYNKKRAVLFANFEAMERFYDIEFFSKNFLALYVNILVLCLVIFGLAGTSVSFEAETSDFSHIIAIDTSESMSTSDVSPSRFEVAKEQAKAFVDFLPIGTEIGVISFSGDSIVLQSPDTSKVKAKMAIDEIDYGIIHGTNIYNALISANKVFGLTQMKSVLLISDGQFNTADAPQILRYINRNNLVVNAIAIGTKEGGVTEHNTISKIDEDFLKSLAFNSGGEFFAVEDEANMNAALNSLVTNSSKRVDIDLTFYLLSCAIIIFTILWILYNLRLKVVP